MTAHPNLAHVGSDQLVPATVSPSLLASQGAARAAEHLIDDWAAGQVTVSLADLNDRAELLTRVDRKYVVHPAVALVALRECEWRAHRTSDAIAVLGTSSGYSSVYFDTPDLLSYHLTATRRRRRFKVRTRSYLDTGDTFLEVKTRGRRATTVKERIPYSAAQPDVMTADAADYIGQRLAPLRLGPADIAARLSPVLSTRYRRITILQADGESRATVDLDLIWAAPGGGEFRPGATVILETKSAGRASPLDQILWRLGQRPQKISKFGTGLALLNPQLPANKWTRVLARLTS